MILNHIISVYKHVTDTVKLNFLYTANSLQHFGKQSAEVMPK